MLRQRHGLDQFRPTAFRSGRHNGRLGPGTDIRDFNVQRLFRSLPMSPFTGA